VDGLDVTGRGKRAKGKSQQNTALLDSAEGEAHNAWRKNKTKTRARNTSLSVYLSLQCTDVYSTRGRKKKEKEKTAVVPSEGRSRFSLFCHSVRVIRVNGTKGERYKRSR